METDEEDPVSTKDEARLAEARPDGPALTPRQTVVWAAAIILAVVVIFAGMGFLLATVGEGEPADVGAPSVVLAASVSYTDSVYVVAVADVTDRLPLASYKVGVLYAGNGTAAAAERFLVDGPVHDGPALSLVFEDGGLPGQLDPGDAFRVTVKVAAAYQLVLLWAVSGEVLAFSEVRG
jgi:hypothetical protein